MPRSAVTVGMAPILAAREVALVVRGAHKRDILERTLHGPEMPTSRPRWRGGRPG